MYRCCYCKDPVTIKEHQTILKELGPIDVGDGEIDNDCFDNEGNAVICKACVQDVEVEVEGFDWKQEYDRQLDSFLGGNQYIESGICLKCGRSYKKTIGESNISRSGYCFSCGYNP